MANYAVNGVPLFGPAQSGAEHHRRWLRTDDPLAVVDSLRDVSRSAERIFGVGLQPLLLDFVMLVRSARAAAAVGGLDRRRTLGRFLSQVLGTSWGLAGELLLKTALYGELGGSVVLIKSIG
jgi:hypothetical protein